MLHRGIHGSEKFDDVSPKISEIHDSFVSPSGIIIDLDAFINTMCIDMSMGAKQLPFMLNN